MLHVDVVAVHVLDGAYALYGEEQVGEEALLFVLVHAHFTWSLVVEVVVVKAVFLVALGQRVVCNGIVFVVVFCVEAALEQLFGGISHILLLFNFK